ncbi:MAG: hypothetical protein HWD92_06595 [Flavobacteriia bacterium]|nr:hypothetical protein [Flavobacteriia bacterium]
MRSELRRTFGLMLLFVSGTLSAQISVSPYSIFGNGDREPGKFAHQFGMGGVSAALHDPLQINIAQPASFSRLKYTTIELGGFYQESQFNDGTNTAQTGTGGFNYLAFGFPLSEDWGLVAGLAPYTKIGYEIETQATLPFSTATVQYFGSGGYDRAYMGTAYELFDRLSIGVMGSYYFGTAERTTLAIMDDRNFYSTGQDESIRATGFNWEAGMQYTQVWGADSAQEFTVGATFSPITELDGTLNDYYYTFAINGQGNRLPRDTVYNINNEQVNVIFNSSYSFGASYGVRHPRLVQYAWSITGDYQMLNRSELSSSSELRGTFENGFRASVGGQFIPFYALDLQRSNFFNQIDYRIGAFYENSGLVLNEQVITDRGFTVGMGIPLSRRTNSAVDIKIASLNVGMVFGQRGLQEGGNIQENYARFVVGLTLNDKWFTQFKYR